MTDVQVFKWFCKEQGIMANIRGMYYVCSPTRYSISGYKSEKISFEKWIHDFVYRNGFLGLMERILSSYNMNLQYASYDCSIPLITGMATDKFINAIKRWHYFVRHNIIIDENILKVGDIVTYKRPWAHENDGRDVVVVDTLNIKEGYVHGHIYGTEGKTFNDMREYMCLDCIMKENETEPIRLDYSIKRKGRIYNGANR